MEAVRDMHAMQQEVLRDMNTMTEQYKKEPGRSRNKDSQLRTLGNMYGILRPRKSLVITHLLPSILQNTRNQWLQYRQDYHPTTSSNADVSQDVLDAIADYDSKQYDIQFLLDAGHALDDQAQVTRIGMDFRTRLIRSSHDAERAASSRGQPVAPQSPAQKTGGAARVTLSMQARSMLQSVAKPITGGRGAAREDDEGELAPAPLSPSKMRVAAIRAALLRRSLSDKGKKTELAERLRQGRREAQQRAQQRAHLVAGELGGSLIARKKDNSPFAIPSLVSLTF